MSLSELLFSGRLTDFFAAQQLIDFIEEARGETIRPVNKSLRDNEVFPILHQYCADLPLDDAEKEALDTALTMIQTMIDIRHHMAHMALRRHPDVDALIGISLRRRENFRKASIEPRYGQAMIVYIPMPEVCSNFDSLEKNVNFLASLYVRLSGKGAE